MISFKQYPKEYNVNPMGDPSSREETKEKLKKSKLIKTIKHNNLEIELYLNELARNSHTLIAVINKEIFGYVSIQIFGNTDYWQVLSTIVYDPSMRGQGIMPVVYLNLLDLGYSLLNGSTLSSEAERMWKKLISQTKSNTYDSEENKLLPTDDKPSKDNIPPYVGDQRYFWLIQK